MFKFFIFLYQNQNSFNASITIYNGAIVEQGGGVSSINTMLFYFCREIELMSLLLIPKINKMQLLHEYFYYTYPYLPKFKYKQCRV